MKHQNSTETYSNFKSYFNISRYVAEFQTFKQKAAPFLKVQ